ncbi:MAG: VWA domain-containing protein [Clostridiaceae bacterium]|jgi:Ca-activated chloride channel homolog|nr:VWA domain-containing protein [Clostridiaceae bacterium]
MKNIFLILILIFIFLPVFANPYNLQKYDNYNKNMFNNDTEKVLFILDFSNSMTEALEETSKLETMLDTMKKILPSLNPNAEIGLRVYGHRMGFTQMDACRASTLLNPIQSNNAENILSSLQKTKPHGMTPITYSLKQAVYRDFQGVMGDKHIILLTDGGENCDESPCEYVMQLVKLRRDIHIDVIAFNINNDEDLDQLKCTALVTSGKFYNANTSAQLAKSLGNSLNKQKRVEAKIITNP